MKKYRLKTWWWGKWISYVSAYWDEYWRDEIGRKFPSDQVPVDIENDPAWEEYDEEKHGAHNEKYEGGRI